MYSVWTIAHPFAQCTFRIGAGASDDEAFSRAWDIFHPARHYRCELSLVADNLSDEESLALIRAQPRTEWPIPRGDM